MDLELINDKEYMGILALKYILPYQKRNKERCIQYNKIKNILKRTKKKRIKRKKIIDLKKLIDEELKDYWNVVEEGRLFSEKYKRDVR